MTTYVNISLIAGNIAGWVENISEVGGIDELDSSASVSVSVSPGLTNFIQFAGGPLLTAGLFGNILTLATMGAAVNLSATSSASLETSVLMSSDSAISVNLSSDLQTLIQMDATPIVIVSSSSELITSILMSADTEIDINSASSLQTVIQMVSTPSVSLDSTLGLTSVIQMTTLNSASVLEVFASAEFYDVTITRSSEYWSILRDTRRLAEFHPDTLLLL